MKGAQGEVVDVHAHVLLSTVESVAAGEPGLAEARNLESRRNGPESLAVSGQMIRDRIPQLTDLARRLSDMDAAGVDVQVVSPSPSQYHYWASPGVARELWGAANEGVAALVAAAPSRIRGLGLVPLQHPELCVAALDHALDLGLVGVEISSFAPEQDGPGTVELSDARLEPFWARAAEKHAVVFLHPFGCSLDERLDRYYLSNSVGQPVENAVALSHLIVSGVLDRHPSLRVIVAHGGGYLPYYLGRSDHAWAARPDARVCNDLPSSYVSRMWFDSLVYTPRQLAALVEAVGVEQVLLGSDYPFDMGVTGPVERVQASGLSADEVEAICVSNVLALGLQARRHT